MEGHVAVAEAGVGGQDNVVNVVVYNLLEGGGVEGLHGGVEVLGEEFLKVGAGGHGNSGFPAVDVVAERLGNCEN